MSSEWTLGGTACQCLSVNLGLAQTDTAECEFPDGAGGGLTEGAWYELACDGHTVLWGQATVHPHVSGAGEARRITLRGPWALLEKTIYQQTTHVTVAVTPDEDHPYGYALTTVKTPSVLLGMADDGTSRTSLQEAQAILTYAAGAGVPLTLDAGFTGRPLQPVPQEGASCAACLLTVLRYHPDVLVYFAYESTGAVLMLTPAGSTDSVTIAGGDEGADLVLDAEFSPVPDYAPEGIRILYQRVGAGGRLEVQTDTAGDTGSQGQAPNVINWLVPLEGADPPPLVSQRIRTRPIPHNDDPEHPEEDETEGKTNFWQAHLPWLDLSGMGGAVTISAHTVTVDAARVDASAVEGEVDNDWSTDPGDYPRELVDGTVPPWLAKVAAPVTVSARFTLASTAGLSDAVRDRALELFGDVGGEFPCEVKITGTDASTREYTALASGYPPPDWPASGVAAAYMAAFTAAAWQGSVALTGGAQPRAVLGTRLNVTGFETDWASMDAVVQRISYAPQSHQLTLAVNAPDNFGFGDFYELQRTMRKAAGTDARAAAARRQFGLPNNRGRIHGAGWTPHRSVTGGGAAPVITDLVPWACVKSAALTLRIYPAPVYDGTGAFVWPVWDGNTASPESFWDLPLIASEGYRYYYLELTVGDGDDYHGLVTAAELKGTTSTLTYLQNDAGKVLIPIGTVNVGASTFTATPLRTYVFCARRYGPPGSVTWDVEPL